jgi:hypothetical protein
MEETHQDSLALHLPLNHKELCTLLLASGLAHLHRRQFQINRSQGHSSHSWQHFLVEQSLEGYFDSMAVNKKRHFWIIGLGLMKKKLAGSFNPATQSLFFKTNHVLLQKSRWMMLDVLHLYNQPRD